MTGREIILLLYAPPEARRHLHRCPDCGRESECFRLECGERVSEFCTACVPDDEDD